MRLDHNVTPQRLVAVGKRGLRLADRLKRICLRPGDSVPSATPISMCIRVAAHAIGNLRIAFRISMRECRFGIFNTGRVAFTKSAELAVQAEARVPPASRLCPLPVLVSWKVIPIANHDAIEMTDLILVLRPVPEFRASFPENPASSIATALSRFRQIFEGSGRQRRPWGLP